MRFFDKIIRANNMVTYYPGIIFQEIFAMELNDLSYQIRGAIYTIHNQLGPGLLESVYQAALSYELSRLGLKVQTQVGVPVQYKEVTLHLGFIIDVLVEDQIIIEVKSVEALHNVHKKQLLTYLKLSGKKLGFLANFNTARFIDKDSLVRIIN